jgi:hypothetical protein
MLTIRSNRSRKLGRGHRPLVQSARIVSVLTNRSSRSGNSGRPLALELPTLALELPTLALELIDGLLEIDARPDNPRSKTSLSVGATAEEGHVDNECSG